MGVRRLGIVMNGVTGRMGTNQHLVRSIVAIRAQGGVALTNGDRVMPDPILVGRNEDKLAALAKANGIDRVTTDLDAALADPNDTVFFDAGHHADARRPARQSDRGGQAHLLREAGRRPTWRRRSASCARPRPPASSNGVVQDKLFLPGLRKLKLLIDSGFFGRIFAVKGEFGYWVFEGDLAAGPAPVVELSRRGRRRHHPRHALPLALRARQHFRQRALGVLPRRDAHPRARRRGRQALRGHRRRRRLRHLPARRRHRSPTSTARGRRACAATTCSRCMWTARTARRSPGCGRRDAAAHGHAASPSGTPT